jgi:diguanylate cyclase (GGDEF)-like protein
LKKQANLPIRESQARSPVKDPFALVFLPTPRTLDTGWQHVLCSPTAEKHEEETPPPDLGGLPDDILIPWQRMLSLLRTIMDVPVALVLRTHPLDMEVLLVSQDESAPIPAAQWAPLALTGSFCEKVMATRARLLVEDARNEAKGTGSPAMDHGIAYLGEPIFSADGSVFGILCVLDQKPNPFPHQTLLTEFRHTMESQLLLMESRRALAHEIEKTTALTQRLAREAATDPLTGLRNRRSFDGRFQQEIARHKRAKTPLSIIICDLDRFREFNDTKGRTAGDELLVTLATLFKERLRTHDLIWRTGGDEFLLLLPDTPLMGAVEVVESVRALVEERAQLQPAPNRVTMSAGVTNFNPKESQDGCLNRCNRLLEAAKAKGRNCVILG